MAFKQSLLAFCVALMAFFGAFSATAQEAAEDTAQSAPKEAQGPMLPMIRGDFRDMRLAVAKAKVTDVIDGVTIEVDGKHKVRLVGVWVPWDSPEDPGDNVKKAQTLLKKFAMGRMVRLYQPRKEGVGTQNRLGQILAQVERDDGLWLQGALIYSGLATVMTSPSNPESASRMYQVEADARKRKAGLWDDARWAVLTPEKATDFVNEYRIVEGRVFSTAMKNNVFYINFSRDWRTDFTVTISSDKRLTFAREGINLMGLNGKTIRVRGWVRNFNGPMIEITHPEQIEVVK
ncbi:MAG: thermonuclease family protein [Alphaproteobacteria bacterium]|nr:thermonuclease family protein [Alphaproteobacteria bacterium]